MATNARTHEAGTLSNADAREWYRAALRDIPRRLDRSLTHEEQARQAYRLRCDLMLETRRLMADSAQAASLADAAEWEAIVDKYRAQGRTGRSLWQAIIEAASRAGAKPRMRQPGQ